MATLRGTLLASIACLAIGTVTASAADLGKYDDYSVKDYAPAIYAKRSWYIRGDAGYAVHDDPFLIEDNVTNLINPGYAGTWTFGGGIGKYFTDHVRSDLTVEYRTESDVSGRSTGANPGLRTFGLRGTLVMANVYYDFGDRAHFSPYLGVGLGAIRLEVADGIAPGGTIAGGEQWNTAASVMAGFSTDLTKAPFSPFRRMSHGGLHLDVGYRFLYMGEAETGAITSVGGNAREITIEDLHAHEIRVGLRYEFR